MRLKILVNATFESEKALVDLDTKKVIMSGDYYHDKIDEQIKAYLEYYSDLGVKYEMLEEQLITPEMEMFEICSFYNDSDD